MPESWDDTEVIPPIGTKRAGARQRDRLLGTPRRGVRLVRQCRLFIQQRRRFAAESWGTGGAAPLPWVYERAAALPANSRLHRGKWGLDWQT